MTLLLSPAISCAYNMCGADGHGVCPVVKTHMDEVNVLLARCAASGDDEALRLLEKDIDFRGVAK